MKPLEQSRRVVIKIGSALLIHPEHRRLRHYWLAGLAKDIAALRAEGKDLCIVCSGAVALGRDMVAEEGAVLTQEEKQAAAACGQRILMQHWQEVFAEDQLDVAQILLTLDDSDSRRRFLNARSTLSVLLGRGIIPIVNENDTVATSELRVGDNDRLAARVAQMMDADMLVLLSDVDGLYERNPATYPDAAFIPYITQIDERIRQCAGSAGSAHGTGGMITKIEAAQIATASGCHTVIANGQTHRPIEALLQGAQHSLFEAQTTPISARKEWIAGSLAPGGVLHVDRGAMQALNEGNSLLPIGIKKVSGSFGRGDAVLIQHEGRVIAKGLVCYHSEELAEIIGKHTSDIATMLGYDRGHAIVHRDDMVMM